MNVLFMGTPDFACFSLSALLGSTHRVTAVVTQPDKPRGRGYTLTPPPVKVAALEAGLPVYQPTTLRDESFAALLQCQRGVRQKTLVQQRLLELFLVSGFLFPDGGDHRFFQSGQGVDHLELDFNRET